MSLSLPFMGTKPRLQWGVQPGIHPGGIFWGTAWGTYWGTSRDAWGRAWHSAWLQGLRLNQAALAVPCLFLNGQLQLDICVTCPTQSRKFSWFVHAETPICLPPTPCFWPSLQDAPSSPERKPLTTQPMSASCQWIQAQGRRERNTGVKKDYCRFISST